MKKPSSDAVRDATCGGCQWFVLGGSEQPGAGSIRESILRRIRMEGMEEYFGEIFIPTEKVVETKGEAAGPGTEAASRLHDDPDRAHDETWHLVR